MIDLKMNFKNALLDFDREEAEEILMLAFKNGNKTDLVPELITDVLTELGDEWERGELALSQIYMTGKICEGIIESIIPEEMKKNRTAAYTAVVTFNDYHVLGKKILYSILRSAGFNILDYGHGVSINGIIKRLKSDKIKFLLISTLMLHSALEIKELKKEIEKQGISVKIMVGGAPFIFDELLWKQVGADAMGKTPTDAINILKQWIN